MLHDPKFGGQSALASQHYDAAEPSLPGQIIPENQRLCAGQTQHPQAKEATQTTTCSPADTELSGQPFCANHHSPAAQPQTDCCQFPVEDQHVGAAVGPELTDEGHVSADNQTPRALVGEIAAVYRRYEDLRRARQRLELQAMATCRIVCGGDKVAGAKLYKSPTPEVAVWLAPYEAAMAPLTDAIKEQEKLLTKLGKQLPVAKWADTVPGLSHRFLAAIVGECGIGPGEYRSVSALWKRMGMAVINGGRQRRVTGDAALEHGYVARRRSLMWNIGDQVAVRQGIRNPKDEDGKPTGAVAINEWGALYLERKEYELARESEPGKPMTPMHAHNRAKRYVEKRLLRELWKAWRKATNAEISA
ncbi:MAG: hypothetical protein ACTHNA_14335 [Sphingopyxis terrae]|uniref:hypothetical protein n=1 Tax=Sphingopyxis terrae TaxID=33052 RepID=UPI003F7D181E